MFKNEGGGGRGGKGRLNNVKKKQTIWLWRASLTPVKSYPADEIKESHMFVSHFEFLLTRFNLGKFCSRNEMSWYCSYFSLFPSFTGWEENKLCGAFSFVPVNFTRRHKTGANTNFGNRFPQSFILNWFIIFDGKKDQQGQSLGNSQW